jgi:two-component system sensor histidine kinase PilS (NtrC family)
MIRARYADRLPEPHRILSWCYVGRLTLAGAIFVAAAWVWQNAPVEATLQAALLLVATVCFTFASFVFTHVWKKRPGRTYLYGQVVFDVFLVTWIVHLTGGKESAFAPLYILVICAAAVLLPILGGILIGMLASIVYFAGIVWSAHSAPDAGVLLQIALFTTVALVTGYLGDRLRQTGTVLGEVETELRMLRLDTDDILGSIATGILTVDRDGHLAYVNPAGAELLGLPPHQWLGRAVLPVLDRAAPGMAEVILRTFETGDPVSRYETGETPDGLTLGVSTTRMERPEPHLPTVTAIFQDITERKRLDSLRVRAERLEAVAELSASLAHEIRNPLASIRSAVEQLTGDGVDAEDRAILQGLVVRESDRLSGLLTEFIDFARVRVRLSEPVDLMQTARNVVQLARAHPQAAGVDVRFSVKPVEEGLYVAGDEDLLHRALVNLALNGVQWAGPGGTVEISVDTVQADLLSPSLGAADAVRVRVCDTGPGVPEDEREHIFDPFFTRRPGGTGLGLALVARAADAHGGAVFVDGPAEGWGAVFTLYLPALADARAAVPAGPARDATPPEHEP